MRGGLSLRPVKNIGDICECLSIEFTVLILYFVLKCFIYFTVSFVSRAMQIYCYTILVVVTSILIVHFDICILHKCFFDGSGEKCGKEEALQEGGNEPDFESRFGGNRSH